MGKLAYSLTAKGVPREKLFEWLTDYSPEDVDILKRRSSGQLLSRTCVRDGNKLHVVSELRGIRGKPMKANVEVVLHPEDYTYDVHESVAGSEIDTHYTLTQLPEGTRLSVEAQYRATGRLMKFLVAVGIMRMLGPRMHKSLRKAFVAEAEEQLGSKQSS